MLKTLKSLLEQLVAVPIAETEAIAVLQDPIESLLTDLEGPYQSYLKPENQSLIDRYHSTIAKTALAHHDIATAEHYLDKITDSHVPVDLRVQFYVEKLGVNGHLNDLDIEALQTLAKHPTLTPLDTQAVETLLHGPQRRAQHTQFNQIFFKRLDQTSKLLAPLTLHH